jgi:alanine racemase
MDRQAHVDLATVTGNIRALREHVRGSQVMAVVKQDGYGHGALPCARAALAGGATWLGVAHIAEALLLRQAGLEAPVLCLGAVPGEEYQDAIVAGVDVTSGSAAQLTDVIAVAAVAAGRTARVQLKADTGLGRGGARPDQWLPLVEAALAAQQRGLVTVTGLWSHFACSDVPGHPSVAAQLAAFDQAVTVAKKAGVTPAVTHIANTAAAITVPESRLDLVRIGGGMYGLSTLPGGAPSWLPPAMSLRAKLAMVKRVPAGTGVSYGLHYVTDRETTLGLVPLGYADGIRRSATRQPLVGFNGRRFPIAGTVCMDQFVVDFGDEPVAVGDEVVLFGPGGPSAQEWGEALGTISYEITVGLGTQVPRTFSHNSTTASPRTGS